MKALAEQRLLGTHLMLVPRNSLFFVPESDIRARILASYPEIEAVSMTAPNLQTLSISSVPRASAFWWCGVLRDQPSGCYATNAEGLIFKPVDADGSQGAVSGMLLVYAPIDGDATNPVRAHVTDPGRIPNALQLVKSLRSLGADITSVALRGDEADLFTKTGTRIIFVLGREEAAAALAATAFPALSLNDGSLEYVDLRFDGKVYSKKHPH